VHKEDAQPTIPQGVLCQRNQWCISIEHRPWKKL